MMMSGVMCQRGRRFHPTDSELMDYLIEFVTDNAIPPQEFIVIENLYGEKEPWDIFNAAEAAGTAGGDASQRNVKYFITPLKRVNNSSKNSRFARTVGKDYMATWKLIDKPKPIKNDTSGKIVGMKRTLRYERKTKSLDENQQWHMKEYFLNDTATRHKKVVNKDYVLCIIKKKYSVLNSQSLTTMQEEKGEVHTAYQHLPSSSSASQAWAIEGTGDSFAIHGNMMITDEHEQPSTGKKQEEMDEFHPRIVMGDGSNFVNCSMAEGNQDSQIQNKCLQQYLPTSSSSSQLAVEGTDNLLAIEQPPTEIEDSDFFSTLLVTDAMSANFHDELMSILGFNGTECFTVEELLGAS